MILLFIIIIIAKKFKNPRAKFVKLVKCAHRSIEAIEEYLDQVEIEINEEEGDEVRTDPFLNVCMAPALWKCIPFHFQFIIKSD